MKSRRQETPAEIEEVEILENIDGETKAERFSRLANFRLDKTVKRIRQLGHLSSRANYEYTGAQVQILLEVLSNEVDKLERQFSDGSGGDELPTI